MENKCLFFDLAVKPSKNRILYASIQEAKSQGIVTQDIMLPEIIQRSVTFLFILSYRVAVIKWWVVSS